ncbi:uncharacterized protein [Amphiura filiformis]|uniref:uncharacterized protein n=1 Tax=Amphiura filiformis TaxID=82378 RepID=UPI003B22316A
MCLYPNCKRKNSKYMRLTDRHLPKHGLSKQRYELIKDMMKMQAKFINKTDGAIRTSFSDFCPAMQELYPGCEIDFPDEWFKNVEDDAKNIGKEAILPKEELGDRDAEQITVGPPTDDQQPSRSQRVTRSTSKRSETYPAIFLFSETLLSHEVNISSASKKVTLTSEDGEFQVTFRFKKLLRSENHKRCFMWSLFWPSERLRMKLRRETLSSKDECMSFHDFRHALKPDDHKEPWPLDYQCYLCHEYHPLFLYAALNC